MNDFNPNKKINLLPLPYIGMFDLDILYQTSDTELLYQILSKVNEISKSQNIIIDNFEKILEWANNMIETYTKEILLEWLNDGTLENMINQLGNIIRYYDTTIECLQDQTLLINQLVITKGYKNINDRGGATLFITENKLNDLSIKCYNGYATIINDVLNIRQYGNIDELLNFQQLIDYCYNNEISMYIPYGKYIINDNGDDISFYKNICSIYGDGNGSKIIAPIGSQKSLFEIKNIDVSNIIIENLWIGGNNNDFLGDYNTLNNIFYFNLGSNEYIRNITFNKLKIGKIKGYFIYQKAASNINYGILNCIVSDCEFYSQLMYAERCNMMLFRNNIVYRSVNNNDGRYAFNITDNLASYGITFVNNDVNLPSIFKKCNGLNFISEYYEIGNIDNPTNECVILFEDCRIEMSSCNVSNNVYSKCVVLKGNTYGTIKNSQFFSSIEIDYVLYTDNKGIRPMDIKSSSFSTLTKTGLTNCVIYGYTYKKDYSNDSGVTGYFEITPLNDKSIILTLYIKLNSGAFRTFELPITTFYSSIPLIISNNLNKLTGYTYQFEKALESDIYITSVIPCDMFSNIMNQQGFKLINKEG